MSHKALQNRLWMSRLAEAEAHLQNILLFLKKQSQYALSRADLKHLKIEVHDFDFKDGTIHAQGPIQSFFKPRSKLREGLVELTKYDESYERWLKNSHSLLFTYDLMNEVLLSRIVNGAVRSFRKYERLPTQTAEELETEWGNIETLKLVLCNSRSYGGSYTTSNVNFAFEVLKAFAATKHHHCHRLIYMDSDAPERKDLQAQLEPPEVKHIREVDVPEEKRQYMQQCAESFKEEVIPQKNLWKVLNSCGVYHLQPERKNSPSTAELIVLISWMLGAMRLQKRILGSKGKKPTSPNLVFPIQVVSFKPGARVRILHAYYDGVLRIGMSDTRRLEKRSDTTLKHLLQWAWPTPMESTTKPVLPLGSISEEDEDECCHQETKRMGGSIIKKCSWEKGLEKLDGMRWRRKLHVNVKCKCLRTHWDKDRK